VPHTIATASLAMGLGCSKKKQVGPVPETAAAVPSDAVKAFVSLPHEQDGLASDAIPSAPSKEPFIEPAKVERNLPLSTGAVAIEPQPLQDASSPAVPTDAAVKLEGSVTAAVAPSEEEQTGPSLGRAAVGSVGNPEPQASLPEPEVAASLQVVGGAGETQETGGTDQTASLVAVVEAEDWTTAEEMLKEAAPYDPNARTTDWGYSLIRAAAEEGATEVCRLLIARGANVNARDQNNMTPLMGCVVGGDVGDLVTLLLEARADATATTDDNFTALKWATRLNRVEAIRLLRAAGLDGEASCF